MVVANVPLLYLLQDDKCAQVGIELMQTLTVVFPPFIKKGIVGM